MRRINIILYTLLLGVMLAPAQSIEYIPFGHFDQWVTRNIKESKMLGGHEKTIYEIGPTQTINGSKPYTNLGGSPWATSNVLASPMGIVKTSNSVYPDARGSGKCAKLVTQFEECKVLGVVNMEVMVAGSIFLGQMMEPIKSTKNPYSKMEMGIPFAKRPEALVFDYKVSMPNTNERVYSSGFGKKKTYQGSDKAEVLVILQRRWEDNDGHIYAKRVGTARHRFGSSTDWVNGFHLPIHYGEVTSSESDGMGLIPKENSYYAHNSKGKLVPIEEVGWDDSDATPTHVFVMFSSGSGTAYIGTPGLTLWVDNVGWQM